MRRVCAHSQSWTTVYSMGSKVIVSEADTSSDGLNQRRAPIVSPGGNLFVFDQAICGCVL